MISWGLLLLCHEDFSIGQYSDNERTVEEFCSFETFYGAIVEFLVPLIDIHPYSWEYLTSIFWYRIIHNGHMFILSSFQVSYIVVLLFHLYEIHEQSPIIFRHRYDQAFLSFWLRKMEQDYIRYRQVRSWSSKASDQVLYVLLGRRGQASMALLSLYIDWVQSRKRS